MTAHTAHRVARPTADIEQAPPSETNAEFSVSDDVSLNDVPSSYARIVEQLESVAAVRVASRIFLRGVSLAGSTETENKNAQLDFRVRPRSTGGALLQIRCCF